MKDFTEISKDSILFQSHFFFIIKDAFPVSPGHLLIVSNELKRDFFELSYIEHIELGKVIEIAKQIILQEYKPDGYNIGMNCGEAAGQTIFHFHCHVIPRYNGDMESPRGGVRHVIPLKANY